MTAQRYRNIIAALNLTQAEAAAVFGVTDRTGRNWAKHGPPVAVAICLHLVARKRVTLDTIASLAQDA